MAAKRDAYRHGRVAADAVRAARALLETGGPAAVSVRKIAAQLGVAHRALYNHFADLEDLMATLAADGFRDLAAATAAARTEPDFAGAFLRFALAHPQLYALMMAQPNRLTRAHPALAGAVAALIEASLKVLGEPDAPPEANRRRVMRRWMLLHGGLSLRASGVLAERSEQAFVAEMQALLAT